MLESAILKAVRLTCSKLGIVNFRNNVGDGFTRAGNYIRFGLCPGSSDIIGFKTVLITEEYLGKKIAVFVAIETKNNKGFLSLRQKRFIDEAIKAGAIAFVARESADVERGLMEWKESL